jgi:methylated-DNA-[protein]-cysteine S-methyltransferase
MTDLERMLSELRSTPPSDLERKTVVGVGAADQAARTDSPIGPVWIAWSTRGVTALSPLFETSTFDDFMEQHRRATYEALRLPSELLDGVTSALDSGDSSGVEIDMTGLGDFQRSVLAACATIPVGHVRPYGWIASEIDNPGSVRAVGTALGRNPIPLIVPCHRVVRSDGSVGNYAFGPEIKHDLLVREGALLA